jgi:hypothetical protein
MIESARAILFARSMCSSMLELRELEFDGVNPAATGRPRIILRQCSSFTSTGYLNRVQASRQLEREAGRNLELMWLTGQLVPDQKPSPISVKTTAPPSTGFAAVRRVVPQHGPAGEGQRCRRRKQVQGREQSRQDFTQGKRRHAGLDVAKVRPPDYGLAKGRLATSALALRRSPTRLRNAR